MCIVSKSISDADGDDMTIMKQTDNKIEWTMYQFDTYEGLKSNIKYNQAKCGMIEIFTNSICHDLKSPAIGISGLTMRLLEKYKDVFDSKGKEYCRLIIESSKQILDLVDKINQFLVTNRATLKLEKVKVLNLL